MVVNIITFFSPITPQERVDSIKQRLEETEARIISKNEYESTESIRDHYYYFVGTGGTENIIADFIMTMKPKPPYYILSYNENNSLPAALEVRKFLETAGFHTQIIHSPLDQLVLKINDWCLFSRIVDKIDKATLGLIGEPSSWLVASNVEPNKVKSLWGIAIREKPLSQLLEFMKELSPESNQQIIDIANTASSLDISTLEVSKAGKVVEALSKLVGLYKLDAVTVECFALFEQTGITGCLALSLLNNREDIVVGCEGDVPATFTMFVAKLLTGQPAFMANITDVIVDDNSVIMAHCTIPTEMVSDYEITTHFETDSSAAIRGTMSPQEVTVLKLWGPSLSKYWVSHGELIETICNSCGCRTQIRVKLDESVSYFLDSALANHHVLVRGDHEELFRRFFEFKLGKSKLD
jgi:L-fucose isomerase-like protein